MLDDVGDLLSSFSIEATKECVVRCSTPANDACPQIDMRNPGRCMEKDQSALVCCRSKRTKVKTPCACLASLSTLRSVHPNATRRKGEC